MSALVSAVPVSAPRRAWAESVRTSESVSPAFALRARALLSVDLSQASFAEAVLVSLSFGSAPEFLSARGLFSAPGLIAVVLASALATGISPGCISSG